jgi:HSP90 family molecular chaperone
LRQVGIIEDEKNKKDLIPLLRFYSNKSGEEYTSFDKYVEGMPEAQKSIYYVTGEGRKNAMQLPVVEKLTSRGFEVLLMTEPLDEITIEAIRDYKDLNVVDATKEGLDLEDDEDTKKEKEELNEQYIDICEFLEVELKGMVQKVTVSTLLTDSPAALVQGAYGVSPTMQRYMKAQSVASGGADGNLDSMNQAVLEINPKHSIVQDLQKMVNSDKDSEETRNFALLMYDVASMTGGYEVQDASAFAKRVMSMMSDKAGQGGSDGKVVAELETVVTEPETVVAEPETVVTEPETVVAEPETVVTEPETVVAEPETVAEPEAKKEDEENDDDKAIEPEIIV